LGKKKVLTRRKILPYRVIILIQKTYYPPPSPQKKTKNKKIEKDTLKDPFLVTG
jgi:hypothetical protein